jgi:hypothetical protein
VISTKLRRARDHGFENCVLTDAAYSMTSSLKRVQEISHSSLKFGGRTKLDINSVETAGFARL